LRPKSESKSREVLADAELVRKTLHSRENFGFLMEKYEAKLLRYIMYFTGLSKECAEDVLQETFVKVFRKLNSFNQSLSFSSWIFRIAHNEAINYLKKNKNKLTISLDAEDEQNLSLINILASEENVVKKISGQETSAKVREALTHLRSDYREVLILRYLEQYDLNEISDILKKPLGTIGVLLSRAKISFKELAKKFNLIDDEQS